MMSFDWNAFKNELALVTVEKDALHVYAALIVQIAAALALRRRLSDWAPWLAVVFVELLNETIDIALMVQIRHEHVAAGVHDLVNTMILPSMLLLTARYAPGLYVRGS
jgi:cell shape-determining protein MreD